MDETSKGINEIQFKDLERASMSGFLGLFIHWIIVPAIFLICAVLYAAGPAGIALAGLLHVLIGILWLVMWNSYVIINPNETAVLQFFGKYAGTVKTEGSVSYTHLTLPTKRIV